VPSLNKVQIMGNLGADPETRLTANGNAITSFRVAVNERWGEDKEDTEWFSVVTWNKLAEVCGKHLEKGRGVYVEGRLKTRSWEDKEKVKRYRTELIAQRVEFLDRGAGIPSGEDMDYDVPFEG